MHPLNSQKFFGPHGIAVTYFNGTATVTGYITKQVSQNKFNVTDGSHPKHGLILAATTALATTINSTNAAYFTIPVYPYGETGSGGSFTANYGVSTATLVSGGAGSAAGYTASEVLTLASTGGATITVGTVDGGGGILTYSVTAPGTVTVLPANPVAVTGTAGTGATFGLTWHVLSVTSSGGTGYAVNDSLVFNGLAATTEPTAYISTSTSGAATAVTVSSGGTGITTAATSISTTSAPKYVHKIFDMTLITTDGTEYPWALGAPSVEKSAFIPKFS